MYRFEFTPTSKEEKIKFFEFCLHSFNNKDTRMGFCALFQDHFKYNTHSLEEMPELLEYKPEKDFYDYQNTKTDDNTQFWFPTWFYDRGKDVNRIEICEKILAKLKEQ